MADIVPFTLGYNLYISDKIPSIFLSFCEMIAAHKMTIGNEKYRICKLIKWSFLLLFLSRLILRLDFRTN